MLARFHLSALFRRGSSKIALASLTAVVVITLVTFTARAWRSKPSSATRQDAATAPEFRAKFGY